MAKTPQRQIIAHTRLAVETANEGIHLWTPGETIPVGGRVSHEQADAWVAAGCAIEATSPTETPTAA